MSDAATALREPWPDLDRQRHGVSVGIWLFIASEVLFFGALLLGYAVYRALYPEAFRIAGAETEVFYGSVNLLLLLTSSVTMTIAVDASRHGMRRTVIACLALTILLGAAFLLFKGLEYSADIAKGLLPGAHFPLQPAPAHADRVSRHAGRRDLLALRRHRLDHSVPTALSGRPIMSNSHRRPMHIWLRPVAVWVALVLLGLVSLGAAYLPLNAFNTPLNLAIAGVMVILLWLFLMDLIGSDALIRLIAVAGLVWLSFMFALTFSDYFSRACEDQPARPAAFCVDQKINRGAF